MAAYRLPIVYRSCATAAWSCCSSPCRYFGVGARAASEKYDKAQRETDELLREIEEILGDMDKMRQEHDEEVREIEEEDFSGVPIGELLDGANERERRRTDRTEP